MQRRTIARCTATNVTKSTSTDVTATTLMTTTIVESDGADVVTGAEAAHVIDDDRAASHAITSQGHAGLAQGRVIVTDLDVHTRREVTVPVAEVARVIASIGHVIANVLVHVTSDHEIGVLARVARDVVRRCRVVTASMKSGHVMSDHVTREDVTTGRRVTTGHPETTGRRVTTERRVPTDQRVTIDRHGKTGHRAKHVTKTPVLCACSDRP